MTATGRDRFRWTPKSNTCLNLAMRPIPADLAQAQQEWSATYLAARRAFNAMLRDDLVDKVRPEIHKLRDPVA